MKFHLKLLNAPEFRGRNTPSAELDIASKYIALKAERISLKPLMPGGSYFQEVPVEETTVAPQASQLRFITRAGERVFQSPKDVTAGRTFADGHVGRRGFGSAHAPFFQVEVRHEAGAAVLGVAKEDLAKMIETIRQGKRVAPKKMPGRMLEIEVGVTTRKDKTLNVVAYAEGTDPELSKEYITFRSHHDHNPMREGRIHPGSDDNASGVVGMF